MNNFSKSTIYLIISTLLVSSCAGPDGKGGINKQQGGAILGVIAGGLVGSKFGKGSGQALATGAGAILGGLLGNSVGQYMDRQDKQLAEQTSQKALEVAPSGRSYAWKNPDTGNRGYVTPVKTFQARDGRYCREFMQEVIIGEERQKAYGTACRQPDGQWQIVKE